MKVERLTELRVDAEKCMAQGEGYHPHVGARELLELVEFAEVGLSRRQKEADRARRHRGGAVAAGVEKIAQKARKAAKKKPAAEVETADTVEAVAEKLAQIAKPKMQAGSQMGEAKDHSGYHAAAKEAYAPARKPVIPAQPAESALPEAYRSVIFSRVKLPSQIKFDPTAAQEKPAKKGKA